MDCNTKPQYLEWLTVIAKSRLIFNTMEELETYLDNNNISSNGVKRAFTSPQKIRSAFNDLYMHVRNVSDCSIKLDSFMKDYKKASDFYRKKLARRINPENIAVSILKHFYSTENDDCTKTVLDIIKEIENEDIDITMTVMMLLHALNGYDSKSGDPADFGERYDAVMGLLEEFTKECPYFEKIPALTMAMREKDKTRITLYKHVETILNLFSSYNSSTDIMELSETIKRERVPLSIEGFWNECGGRADRTDFWMIEETIDEGIYFATKYNKLSNGKIEKACFMMTLSASPDGRILMYMTHPKSPKHLLAGIPYDESDHVWYMTDMPSDWSDVGEIRFFRRVPYKTWQPELDLTKVTDEKTVGIYESLLESCEIVNPYQEWEYQFDRCLYAVTREALYIESENEGRFYRVPLELCEAFSGFSLNSNVGRITMNGNIYLAFDDILWYIPKKKFSKHGITEVEKVE